jgi:hypothetical protein
MNEPENHMKTEQATKRSTVTEALREAIAEKMERDETVSS